MGRWFERILDWLSFWRPNDNLIGIELDALSVRTVVLTRHLGKFHVKKCAMEYVDGDDVAAVQLALSKLLTKQSIDRGRVAVVSSAPVMSRMIMLPTGLSDDEIDVHIRLDAHKHIPYPLDEVNFDFSVVSDDGKQMQVLLVVVRTVVIDECVNLLASCGLEINVFDVSEFALSRALLLTITSVHGRVLVVHMNDAKIHVYAVHINNDGDFEGFDYRQEYLRASLKPSMQSHDVADELGEILTLNPSLNDETNQEDTTIDTKTKVSDDMGVSNGGEITGMGFDEFLAMHSKQYVAQDQTHESTHLSITQINTQISDGDHVACGTVAQPENCALTSYESIATHHHVKSNNDYAICFNDLNDCDDEPNDDLGKKTEHMTMGANANNINHADDVASIQKVVDAYELGTQSAVDVVVLSGLVDERLASALSAKTTKTVLLANAFEGMSLGRIDVCLAPKMMMACGAAMRADVGGIA
ncbi:MULTISPECIES: type IV pilus biogenesis protein PilM [unclassified Moraxella]|uniref:type IV pilus biogenesis protein PilM n=1 Tax=unclassified Moraxella TaxID=2685852 RepID=UPI002B4130F0|nr:MULTISPECIES: pilus assembly protein PilM [unclassified Moraxella]